MGAVLPRSPYGNDHTGQLGSDAERRGTAIRYHHQGGGDAAEVGAQADAVAELVTPCDGQVLADVSPGGGRHVYVLFAAPLLWRELRDLARAMAFRFPAIDQAPMSSLGGQISPPGSRHKSGGWRLPLLSLEDARAAVEHPERPRGIGRPASRIRGQVVRQKGAAR